MTYNPNSEWRRLDRATRTAVQAMIDAVRSSGQRNSQPWKDGEVYAYPHPRGGVAWGVDSAAGNQASGVQG